MKEPSDHTIKSPPPADPVRGNRCPDGFYRRGCDFMGCCGLRACGGDGLGCPHPAPDDGSITPNEGGGSVGA